MSVTVQITAEDMRQIAWTLVDLHGDAALGVAEEAVTDLNDQGLPESAAAWSALKSVMEDALAGRLHRDGSLTLH